VLLDTTRVVFYGPPDAQKRGKVRGKVKLELAGKMNVKVSLVLFEPVIDATGIAC